MNLLAIDPGLTGCGVAVFSGEYDVWTLERAGYYKAYTAFEKPEMSPWLRMAHAIYVQERPDRLIIELPRVYTGAKNTKGADPNDLIQVAGVVGAVTARFDVPTLFVYPSDWKGQIPKPKRKKDPYIIETRVLRELDAVERGRIGTPGPHWDTIDAIGLGLNHVGRLHHA